MEDEFLEPRPKVARVLAEEEQLSLRLLRERPEELEAHPASVAQVLPQVLAEVAQREPWVVGASRLLGRVLRRVLHRRGEQRAAVRQLLLVVPARPHQPLLRLCLQQEHPWERHSPRTLEKPLQLLPGVLQPEHVQ